MKTTRKRRLQLIAGALLLIIAPSVSAASSSTEMGVDARTAWIQKCTETTPGAASFESQGVRIGGLTAATVSVSTEGSVSEVEVTPTATPDVPMTPSQAARAAGFDAVGMQKVCEREYEMLGPGARTTQAGLIFDGTYCVDNSNGYRNWQGCRDSYRISGDTDPNYRYGAHDSYAWAADLQTSKSLYGVGVGNSYASNKLDITKVSPGSNLTVGSCTSRSYSISLYGVTISSSGDACPERIEVYRTSSGAVPEVHRATWKGKVTNNSIREVNAISGWRLVDPGWQPNHSLKLTLDWR